MISTAQTGYFYTAQRVRQGASLAAVKYDPKGECLRRGLHFGYFMLAFIAVKQRVLFVESKKTAKKGSK